MIKLPRQTSCFQRKALDEHEHPLTVRLGNHVGLSPRFIRSISSTRSETPKEVSSMAASTALIGEAGRFSVFGGDPLWYLDCKSSREDDRLSSSGSLGLRSGGNPGGSGSRSMGMEI